MNSIVNNLSTAKYWEKLFIKKLLCFHQKRPKSSCSVIKHVDCKVSCLKNCLFRSSCYMLWWFLSNNHIVLSLFHLMERCETVNRSDVKTILWIVKKTFCKKHKSIFSKRIFVRVNQVPLILIFYFHFLYRFFILSHFCSDHVW